MLQEIQVFPVTFSLLFLFGGISVYAFSRPELKENLIFSPYRIKRTNEWYRFVSSGFIHADWMHLIFNGYVFYQFSRIIEIYFTSTYGAFLGSLYTIFLFVSGIMVSHITTYVKNTENSWYASLGASGGVSSVLYAYIFLAPTNNLYLLFIPVGIPAIVVGIGYLFLSNYYARNGSRDNINHEAHYTGSLWGVVFMLLINPKGIFVFIDQIKSLF